MVVDLPMAKVAEETKEVMDKGKVAISLIPKINSSNRGKGRAQANEVNVPGQGTEEFNLASIEELPNKYPGDDFDITAIEYCCLTSPKYSVNLESVETVMSPDMEQTLGHHTIVASPHAPSPDLTWGDIEMAMENIRYVPTLPIQPDGTLLEWYQEEIQNSFMSEVYLSGFQNGFIPMATPTTGDNRSSFEDDSVSLF
ncbi:hypothetical protein M404DRAFT_5932 [Pisolithus tinctorius Marx 270]|uniref:Uncharacterized protein n=1 Tax=Pisolithus tinctorius Marx 270 TaxID=870435 RepID=A0A0C3PZK8_PISTI|nr:hypothetical protein M404DRAFT_5932 [Pisolithus tinctorius Marx 270]